MGQNLGRCAETHYLLWRRVTRPMQHANMLICNGMSNDKNQENTHAKPTMGRS